MTSQIGSGWRPYRPHRSQQRRTLHCENYAGGIQLAPMTALAGFPDARKKVLLPREILVDGISIEDALNIMKKFYSPIT